MNKKLIATLLMSGIPINLKLAVFLSDWDAKLICELLSDREINPGGEFGYIACGYHSIENRIVFRGSLIGFGLDIYFPPHKKLSTSFYSFL